MKNSVLNKNTYFKSKTRLQRRKLGLLIHNQVVPAFGYKLFDVRILEKVMAESCICKYCKKARGKLTIKENNRARKGLAECVIFSCNYCSKETITYTSQKVGDGNAMFDVNIRSIYASLPFGREGLAKFCGVMDLPPPVLTPSYQKGREKLAVESSKLAEESMKSAAQRLIDIIMEKHPDKIDIQNDGTVLANVAVSIDGTWQRRGHASKHGVIFLISVETGEVLDYSVKTLYCHECTRHKKEQTNSENYKNWYEGHKPNCAVNYQGSSGAMECQAGVDMFLRSIGNRNLRYTVFVGDGDSTTYGKVCEACVDMYGDSYPVAKEECVGHIQKRMGTGLREFKRKKMGQK